MSRRVSVCELGQAEQMQVSDCVNTSTYVEVSAIDEFEEALKALAKMAGGIKTAAHPEVLSEMLIVSAVASSETFFRRLLSSLAAKCPTTLGNISGEMVGIGAAAAYPRSLLAMSLLERSLFSTRGTVAREIKKFTKYDVAGHADLSAAISAFELVCLTRHAAAHWRGHLDSQGARTIGLLGSPHESYRIISNATLVQRAFAACDYVTHLANDVLFSHISQKWLDEGRIPQDEAEEAVANERCADLLLVFGSTEYCARTGLTASKLRESIVV